MSRRIGFSLKSIGERLPAYRAGKLGLVEMVQALRERIAGIDGEIGALKAQRAMVVDHIRWLRAQEKKAKAKPRKDTPWTTRKRNTSSS